MERKAVLHWLQDVQAAAYHEPNEGCTYPDKYFSSPGIPSTQHYTSHDNKPLSQLTAGTEPNSSSKTATRRNTSKLTRSNTLAGSDIKGFTAKLSPWRAPSAEDVHWSPTSISPLPSFSPDFMLPTINLTQTEPERKPLMQQSSTDLLSKMKNKASKLENHISVTSLQCESASTSPGKISSDSSFAVGDLDLDTSQITSTLEKSTLEMVIGGDMESEALSRSSGSCAAEKGDFSDSGDNEMPKGYNIEQEIISKKGIFQDVRTKVSLHRSLSVTHIRSHSDISDDGLNNGLNRLVSTPAPSSLLTFHDHHLGRVKAHRLLRSPTLAEGKENPTHTSYSKLHSQSPLLDKKL